MSSAHSTNPSLYPKIPHDVAKDFTSVALVALTPYILVVNPAVPARSVAELVAWVKAQPGAVAYGSNTVGGTSRDMTITNTNTGTSSADVCITSTGVGAGATNNTVKNINLIGSTVTATAGTLAGVFSGSSSVNITSAGAHYVTPDFIAVGAANGDIRVMADQVRRAIAWVYKNAERGQIPCVHIGALLRFDPAAIRAWLASKSAGKALTESANQSVEVVSAQAYRGGKG